MLVLHLFSSADAMLRCNLIANRISHLLQTDIAVPPSNALRRRRMKAISYHVPEQLISQQLHLKDRMASEGKEHSRAD